MNLNPRAIALQGIGFTPLLMAAQGLLPDAVLGATTAQTRGFMSNMGTFMGMR